MHHWPYITLLDTQEEAALQTDQLRERFYEEHKKNVPLLRRVSKVIYELLEK